jgi:LytS/YehU family sensor histidine kinase
LSIVVRDTGAGFPAERGKPKSGVGLENVIRRLQLCYGSETHFEIRSDTQGSAVSFTIPAPALQGAARAVEAAG